VQCYKSAQGSGSWIWLPLPDCLSKFRDAV